MSKDARSAPRDQKQLPGWMRAIEPWMSRNPKMSFGVLRKKCGLSTGQWWWRERLQGPPSMEFCYSLAMALSPRSPGGVLLAIAREYVVREPDKGGS